MQKLVLISFILARLFLCIPSLAAETNNPAFTNVAQNPSDAELQKAAKDVMGRILIFGIVSFVGAVVVSGFALYGAYRKFGTRGAIFVAVLIGFGIIALGSLLTIF